MISFYKVCSDIIADKAEGTRVVPANISFSDSYTYELGGVTFEILHLGPAHGPGDTQVWIPQWSMMIAGDIAFHERMLPIFEDNLHQLLD